MPSLTRYQTLARASLVALAGIALLLPASGPVRAADKLTVETDWAPYGVHAALFLAVQKGWFKEAGLDVTVLDGKGSATTIQQVGVGQMDVGFAQLSTMAAAVDKGIAVESIACFVRAGDNGVMVPADSAIHTPKDLIGKRVVFATGSSSASLLDAFFNKAGLKRDQMTLIGVDSSALPGTFITGNADAAVTTVAYFGPIVSAKRAARAIPYSDAGIRVPSFGLVVRKSDVQDKADALKRFVPVTVRAWQYIIDGHIDEAIDAIVAQRPNDRLDKVVMTNQLKEYMKLFDTPNTKGKGIGWQSTDDWKGAIADLKAAGLVQKDLQPDDLFTNRFLPTQ